MSENDKMIKSFGEVPERGSPEFSRLWAESLPRQKPDYQLGLFTATVSGWRYDGEITNV